jgi:hypothetical protein
MVLYLDSSVEVAVWSLRLMGCFKGGRVRHQCHSGRGRTPDHLEGDGGSRDKEPLPASRGLAEIQGCGKAGTGTLS